MRPDHISQLQRRHFLQIGAASALIATPFLTPTPGAAQEGAYQLSDDPTLSTLVQTSAGGPAPASADTLTVRWLGCANHELAFRDQVILLDAWYDRGPRNRPLGFLRKDVTRANLIINGHAHFDHMADIADIARRTAAQVMGAPISIAYLRDQGLPDAQLRPRPAASTSISTASASMRFSLITVCSPLKYCRN